ncbi:sister chromatid cohesion protein PDS5 homolog D-like [Rutidosis leptorrhynchoides]|uniref:sister chromatid cohesion protein PDS5 homolog D-like n=1 Tax=Rutidosis leptorrhynchoides TaxID=125765 RepID=UPI003A99974C
MDHKCQAIELEKQLTEAGQQLSFPPSSIKHLLDLLDKTERLLTCVVQLPSVSMQGALAPSMGTLIGDELIKHSDTNVRVSVASCLSEIARITAPEPSYNDEIMKEIFQLNVMAFGELSNMSGHNYHKAIRILECVAKVNSFLLMLDLDCDDMVLAMFKQFLSKIRSNHPRRVYSDMETIMTLVIKESDKISTELLSFLILHVKKENQNVSPVSWKLAEKVLMNCVDALKPYSETITKLMKSDPDSYAEVVTLICQNANGNEHVVTKWTKRRIISLENGGSTEKQKYIESDRLNGKELETPKKGRPKNTEKPKKLKQDLVGSTIKVWWPLDNMYYKGVVSSYDSITDRYEVLYADGNEELLDLHHEKWIILDNLKK